MTGVQTCALPICPLLRIGARADISRGACLFASGIIAIFWWIGWFISLFLTLVIVLFLLIVFLIRKGKMMFETARDGVACR